MVHHIQSMEEFKAIIGSTDKLVVIDFTAQWCGPCQRIGPFFEGLANKYPQVLFYKVDVDVASDVSGDCGIRAMPTFQFYKCGNKVEELCGADQNKLEALVKQLSS